MNKESGQVVILLAHPNIQESIANKELIESVRDYERVSVYDLYSGNDDLFDAQEWSRILTDATSIVFQFPLYWLSAPYMLKRWEDEVLTHLTRTPAIAGKHLVLVVTAGSGFDSYRSGGRNAFTVDELLRPYQATANHAGLVWQTPLIVYGMAGDDPGKRIAQGAIQYKKIIETLLSEGKKDNDDAW